jgi:putative hydrolase of the HAD superfamily
MASPASMEKGLQMARAFYQAQRWQQRTAKELEAFWFRYYANLLVNLEPPIDDLELTEALIEEVEKAITYHLYPETREVLTELRRRGFAIGAVSNWSPQLLTLWEGWELGPYFDTLVVSDVVGFYKPDPRIFDIALEALQVSAEKAIHVGDDYKADVQGARAAGIKPVLLDRKGQHQDADCLRIHSLKELSRLVGVPCSSG